MQITIVESEIKEAITNHILSQIAVKEGMKVEIELKATRGETGMQAMIDITAIRATAPAKLKPAGRPIETFNVPSNQAIQTIEDIVGEVEAITGVDLTDTAVDLVGEVPSKEEDTKPEVQERVQAATSSKSLFGGLKKPVNTAAE